MRSIFTTLTLLWVSTIIFYTDKAYAQACCPDFILKDAKEICPPFGGCGGDPAGGNGRAMAACKLSIHTYTVYPNDPGFSYTWTITGGTPASANLNPVNILWGNGSTGFIKVVITSLNPNLDCKDSILQEICLLDGPDADFTLGPDTVCVGIPVTFNNTSTGGSAFVWDMGDGTVYTTTTPPPHAYNAPGTYTVTLTATDMGSGQSSGGGTNGDTHVPCGCSDTATAIVVVLPGEGPSIETDCCYGTVCPGDTSKFCTPMVCNNYAWSVTGGAIISGANTNCIEVKWNAVYTGPTTVTLQSCPSSSCPGATTLQVPVLYPNLPISGPTTLCIGASGSYSLPLMPGTFYNWTVNGPWYAFNDKDRNVPMVNISFLLPGSYWVKCEYDNPLAGCDGVDSVLVDVLPKFAIQGPDKVCEGTPTSFTTGGLGPNANWTFTPPTGPIITSGQNSQTVWMVWTPGNYMLTATSLNPPAYCNLTATKNIQVIARPVLNAITGPLTACPGNNYNYQITSNTTGSPFYWSVASGTGTIVSQMGDDNESVVVNFSGGGPWTLSVYQEIEISPGIYCQSSPVTLNINPFPQPVISGNSSVCADAVEPYSAGGSNPPGGFYWSISPSSQGSILSGQGTNNVSIQWHGPAANAVITVTSCSGFDTHNVSINVPPVASVTPNMTPYFCLGTIQTLVLTTPFNGSYTYQWYENGVLMSGQTGNTLSLNISSYTSAGTYQYYVIVTQNGCSIRSNTINLIIDACTGGNSGSGNGCPGFAYFLAYAVCDSITLINQSYASPPAVITNYQWSVTGPGSGVFTPNANAANPGLTVTASGAYTITLTITVNGTCTVQWSQVVNVLLPVAGFTFTNPVCEGIPASFNASPNNPAYNYFWTFGDGYTSYVANTQHAYAVGNPTKYYVNLTITDPQGCVATKLDSITVNPSPVCNITASDTIFCPGSYVILSACQNMSNYKWYKDGNLISGSASDTLHVSQFGEYQAEATNGYGCTSKSNKIYIYMHQRPKAMITGDGYHCVLPGSFVQFYLSTIYNANYNYSWSSLPAGASFSPPNGSLTQVSLTAPFTFPAYYQFIVNVTDTTTGCVNADTICVTFYETPALSIVSIPNLDVCEGVPVTMIPNINNTALYSYMWSNGATTPVITASIPGFYSLTITNRQTGCSATAAAGFIHPKPDLRLFPIGCDHLCAPDTLKLYIPLPLNWMPPNNTYASAYPNISWYDNGNYGSPVGTGPVLNFPVGTSGSHQFSVVVQNSFGCVDTAGVFCLTSSCCDIILESLQSHNATCPELPDGWFTIVLDPASTGGPFTITSIPLVSPFPTTITPGNPLTVNNLPPGVYTVIVTGASENCNESFLVEIGHEQDACCDAEADTLFHKILVNTTYTNDVIWDGKYYLDDNVILTVSSGATLDITNVDVVFGECAGIVFQNGAYLRANNSVFRPCEIDKTWKGLRFVGKGEFDNIINESTFKNAEVALYFQQMADAVISNNLFSNCNYGIRVENNNSFNHPISGNRFVTEQFFPVWACPTKYSFVNNGSTYGIYSTASRFKQQISHNDFINTWGNAAPRTNGIYQVNGGGTISYNTFTDLSYSIFLSTSLFPTILENNEIEINETVNTTQAPIYLNNINSPIIEVNGNEISDNFRQFNCFSAIYAKNSSNISITANQITGFQYGIYASVCRNFQISRNEITDSDVAGIYFAGKGNFSNYITCNEVRMRNFNNTRGLYAVDLTPKSEVSTNCFNDSYISMDFRTFTAASLPKIRNNFLYNYNFVGINAVGYSGNIGTLSPPDPGLNTLWSNYNSAIDINSTVNITVADNFGMFNISWPTVQITSNRPYHSTASCAQQIYNMPSQGNLNIQYTCDNYKNLFTPLIGSGGIYSLSGDYAATLRASEDPFAEADMILASVLPGIQDGLIGDILSAAGLTANEKSLLYYRYYYRNGDYSNARLHLQGFAPVTEDERDYQYLMLLDLDIIALGWEVMTDSDLARLEQIRAKGAENSNFAIYLLNNSPTFRDYLFDVVDITAVTANGEIRHNEYNPEYLQIRPNPGTDKVYIDFVTSGVTDHDIRLYDGSGKLIQSYSARFVSTGIELDISKLTDGFYFVSVTDPRTGVVKAGKLIKSGSYKQ